MSFVSPSKSWRGIYPGSSRPPRVRESSIKLFSLPRGCEKEEEQEEAENASALHRAGSRRRVVASSREDSIFALFAAAAETRPRLFTGRLIASSRRGSSSLVGFPRESLLEGGWKNDVEKRMVRREREDARERGGLGISITSSV